MHVQWVWGASEQEASLQAEFSHNKAKMRGRRESISFLLFPRFHFLPLPSSFLCLSFLSPFLSFLISFLGEMRMRKSQEGERLSFLPHCERPLLTGKQKNLITHYLKISHLQYGADPSVNCEFIVLHVEMICFPYRQPLLYI